MTDPEWTEKDDGEEEEELVILDPDHPLVKRLQDALNSHFRKNLERIKQELSEKRFIKKADDIQLQEVSIEAFRVHELLTKMRNKMEDAVQTKVQAEVQRRQAQDQVEKTKSKFSDLSKKNSQEESHASKLQGKLDKLLQHLSFTQGVSEDLQSNVKTMKNLQHRAGAEKTQAEDQKLQQDLYIDHLTKELERLTRQAAMYEAQKRAQAEETQAAKEAFSEAEMEMESLLLARKQLLQQWNGSLTSIRRKNEAFCEMQEALHSVEHQVILLEREIEGYKKATAAEQERNETLTVGLNWCEMDSATSKKLISQKRAAQEVLQAKYSACLRSLQETERTVATLTKESSIYQSELNDQKKQFEEENSVRLDLEDKIMAYIQQQLMHNKAAKYSQQLISKMAALKKDKMCQLQQMDNDMLTIAQENQQINERLSSLSLIQEALINEADKHNKLLTVSQTNFSSSARLIEQKQVTIANLTKKISIIAANTGRDDLSPLHIKVQGTMAQIDELKANIRNGQELWMLQQGTLVGLSKDLETNSRMMLKLQTQYTGMKQKKIHLESQIEQEQRDIAELEKNSKILERDLEKLSILLSKNQHLSRALEQENALMETHFIQQIKASEWESVSIQMKVEKMQEENEMLLQSLGHAEQQIMLWERKTQILKETYSALDSQMGQEEIQKMKAEIHRMELRVIQLTKQQEQLMRESEAAVAKRESILLQKAAMTRSSHRETTVAELKRSVESLERS
ncbi:coiled-coil domain-containing protein 40, partial [Nematolebias whitei]|uniref:coiled-coil domain-containing protein 40 n=1 Tax=Nematolebias whitei TaxID=451745 RepID=UPI0018972BB8